MGIALASLAQADGGELAVFGNVYKRPYEDRCTHLFTDEKPSAE